MHNKNKLMLCVYPSVICHKPLSTQGSFPSICTMPGWPRCSFLATRVLELRVLSVKGSVFI